MREAIVNNRASITESSKTKKSDMRHLVFSTASCLSPTSASRFEISAMQHVWWSTEQLFRVLNHLLSFAFCGIWRLSLSRLSETIFWSAHSSALLSELCYNQQQINHYPCPWVSYRPTLSYTVLNIYGQIPL